jgi:hypothetical protein
MINLNRASKPKPRKADIRLLPDHTTQPAKENSMNNSSRDRKPPCNLSESTQRRLNSYAMAAGAAGVSALALAVPAEGKIVYTPAHHVIKQGATFPLDVNQDGITDFTFKNSYASTSSGFHALLSAGPAAGNGLEGWTGFEPWAFALKPGAAIGPRHYFPAKVLVVAESLAGSLSYQGSWVNVKNRYLGLQFKIAGKIHYGWARLSVRVANRSSVTATLTGYAYETIPGKPIHAGQTKGANDTTVESSAPARFPAPLRRTLGLLAMGSRGLSLWRREQANDITF